MFHRNASERNDGMKNHFKTVEFGYDYEAEIEREMEARFEDALKEGFSVGKRI